MRHLAVVASLLLSFVFVPVAFAQTQITPPAGSAGQNVRLMNPLGEGVNLFVLLDKILDFVIQIGAIVIVFVLVYIGYLFVMARGNSTQLEEARKALLWTVIGALILLGAKAISLGIAATVQALATGN